MAMPYASLSPACVDVHRSSPAATASLLPFCRSSPFSAGNGGGGLGDEAQQMNGRWAMGRGPLPFTAAQYEELQHQALIYKYLVAGVPVPPDLVLPIRRGIDSLAARFYHNPISIGYGTYLGKKVDPEPGRCRRTDGKKWRCAKEAAPDSKYCERHMHRGRNRSRKPVETQLVAPLSQSQQQQQTPSAAAPARATAFQSHSLYPAIANGGGGAPGSFTLGSTQLHMDNAAPYATAGGGGNKDFRYSTYGVRSLAMDEQSQFMTGAMDTSMDNYSWRLLPSQTSAFSLSSYPLIGTLSGLDQNTICSLPKAEREPFSFFGGDFVTTVDENVKQENQTLRPFFDEWPKARDSWPELPDDTNTTSFPATKLSISIPMTTSDFSTTSSRSPNGIYSR